MTYTRPSFNATAVSTCVGSLGDGFAGGTTDGPGDFNFKQGTNSTSTNAWWNFIAHFLSEPTDQDIKCQHPKVKPLPLFAAHTSHTS